MAKSPKKSTTPKDETKAQKFSRLASARVSRAVKVIAAIGKLSGSGYEYAPEQIAKVGEHLKNAVNGAMRKFDKTSKEATAPEITI